MNCYNHPEEVAVSSCVDCGKGLCKSCTNLYTTPICNECNLKRVKGEKSSLFKVYIPSIIMFILGVACTFYWGSKGNWPIIERILGFFFIGFVFAGIPWGWKAISFLQARTFLFLSWFGWIIYFFIKLFLAYFVGMVALPVGLIKLIISLASANKKEKNINNNLNNN
jgi:hypothetical protein